jgi:hypothetical protein
MHRGIDERRGATGTGGDLMGGGRGGGVGGKRRTARGRKCRDRCAAEGIPVFLIQGGSMITGRSRGRNVKLEERGA